MNKRSDATNSIMQTVEWDEGKPSAGKDLGEFTVLNI